MRHKDMHEPAPETVLLTPFSEGSRPDAFKALFYALAFCASLAFILYLFEGNGDWKNALMSVTPVAILLLSPIANALFCRVGLGDDHVSVKWLLGEKSARVGDIQSVRYESRAMVTRLIILTRSDSVSVSSLSFSARQLRVIRDYCERRDVGAPSADRYMA
jgi:hypothetical protein